MNTKILLLTSALGASACLLAAQDRNPLRDGQRPPGREGSPGGPGGMGQRPPMPIIEALDLNNDGTIDADEIAKASESLKKLDKNGDGKLTPANMARSVPAEQVARVVLAAKVARNVLPWRGNRTSRRAVSAMASPFLLMSASAHRRNTLHRTISLMSGACNANGRSRQLCAVRAAIGGRFGVTESHDSHGHQMMDLLH